MRDQLLDAAGEVFAEKGFHGATSREICARAGVNSGAVNYHFGGFEALYVATLKEAHRRALLPVPFDAASSDPVSPEVRLRDFVRNLVSRLSQSTADSWDMRLVTRELVIPTFAQSDFIATSIEPRRAFLRSLIAEVLHRPPEDPLVGRCMFTVIAPCIMLAMIGKPNLGSLLPDVGTEGEGVHALIDHVERFVLAGLDAAVRTP